MLAEHDRRADAFARPTATFPLHDVTDVFAHGATSRTSRSSPIVCRGKRMFQIARLDTFSRAAAASAAPSPKRMVEPDGIEPTTSCLQSTRSPN